MNFFQVHATIVRDYSTYIQNFLNISDSQIRRTVEDELRQGKLWPEPLLQFKSFFQMFGNMDDLSKVRTFHPNLRGNFYGCI